MEKASGDATAPAAGFFGRDARSVADLGQRLVGLRHDTGIVEFMAAQHLPGGVTGNRRQQRRGPVAEMQATLRKIGFESEQPEVTPAAPAAEEASTDAAEDQQ